MDIEQARRVHGQLAHSLLPFWRNLPVIQPIVHSLLGQWRTLQKTDDEFFNLVIQDLRANGVSDIDLLQAVDVAGEEPVDEHLQTVFGSTLHCAKQLYGGNWTGGDAVSLQCFGCQEPLYPERQVFGAFGAAAITTPGYAGQDAVVELSVAPQLLGPPSWASIPYVLCHELLCHASQAAPSSDPTDPFTEGWMDEVARTVHADNAATLFPWDPAAATEEGGRLCDMLRVMGPHLPDLHLRARAARLQGIRAAQLVQEVLSDLAELSPGMDGRGLFVRLSVELNTVSTESEPYLAAHRQFVSSVLAGRQDRAFAVRRDALLRKWVLDEEPAAAVLSLK